MKAGTAFDLHRSICQLVAERGELVARGALVTVAGEALRRARALEEMEQPSLPMVQFADDLERLAAATAATVPGLFDKLPAHPLLGSVTTYWRVITAIRVRAAEAQRGARHYRGAIRELEDLADDLDRMGGVAPWEP